MMKTPSFCSAWAGGTALWQALCGHAISRMHYYSSFSFTLFSSKIIINRMTKLFEAKVIEPMIVADSDPEVIVFSLKKRYTGVSATVNALVPIQAKQWRLAYVGPEMPNGVQPITLMQALKISRKPAKNRSFRIWHLRRNNEMLVGIIARDILRLPIKLVFTSAAQRRHSSMPRWLISKMDAVICTSQKAADFIANCSAVVPHGIDLSRFPPPADKCNAWRTSGLPGRWGVGLFGRIRPEKGTDIFVDAMIEVLPKHPDACAVIGGLVQPKYQPFYEELQRKIYVAGLSERIVFLGEISADEIHLWYQRCLICVACPRYEAFGLTLFEAAAAECAVIGSRTGAFEQLAIPNQTGDIIRLDDPKGLAESISRMLNNPESALKMGKEANAKLATSFTNSTEAKGISSVYDKLLSEFC